MLKVGFEPTRPYGHGILSPVRLPVSPLEQCCLPKLLTGNIMQTISCPDCISETGSPILEVG